MQPERRHEDRPAVAIVAGIVDVLDAGGDIDSAPQVQGVIGLDDVFPTVIQMAIAEQEAETSSSQVVLVILLDSIRDESDAGAILRAMPPGPAGAHARGN